MKNWIIKMQFKLENIIAILIIAYKSFPAYKKMLCDTYKNYILQRKKIEEKMGSIITGIKEVEEITNI